MGRDISPPPTKRRKTSAHGIQTQTTSPLPPSSPPSNLDDNHTIRLFSWNINGIAPFLQKPITSFFQTVGSGSSKNSREAMPPASLRGFLHRHGWPAVLFLQEVKIAAKDVRTQDAVRTAVNARLPIETLLAGKRPLYEAYFTLPSDPHNARGLRGSGKVYGVCSIIRSDLFSNYQAKVRTVDWDREGRISIVELSNSFTKFALFNIYAVNGTDNPYRDPSTGTDRGTRHDRKLEFHRLLMEECIRLENEGWHILLAGDMNVAPDERDGHPRLRTFPRQHVFNRADFKARFLGGKKEVDEVVFDGIDVWRKMHGDQRRYTYHSRGREWGSSCDRVDYVVIGRKSWNDGLVRNAGILDSEAERGPSDHVPIWVDFKMEDEARESKT
ncbi:DNase I-like protein [Byssothecium circinans]|uniref:DNase I-like protein n=1 Tax=Byssothecium circinans TaxID=147558 RepID=A0A6A5TMG2_9PLEO|nr:DNase I-like protein [Byssothecium circinans]